MYEDLLNELDKKYNDIFLNFTNYILQINNDNLPLEDILHLIVKINNKKFQLSTLANIVKYSLNVLKIEVFVKKNINFIKKTLINYYSKFSFEIKDNCLYVKFPQTFFSITEKIIKKKNIFEKFKLSLQNLRRKSIDQFKNIDKNNINIIKKKIDIIHSKNILKLENLIK